MAAPMAQTIPLDRTEVEEFTPDALKGAKVKPVFRLKAADRRDRRLYQRLLILNNATGHSQDDVRREVIAACEAMWDADTAAREVPRLKAYFDADDEYAKEVEEWRKEQAEKAKAKPKKGATAEEPKEGAKDEVQPPKFDYPDAEACEKLVREISKRWPPLREIMADNLDREQTAPMCLCAVVVGGWDGMKAPFRLVNDTVPLDTMEAMMEELAGLSADAPFQLLTACTGRLFLRPDTEKN